ncbi:uncharacterized protein LOC108932272 [Scleropages formosus]|uniref:Uncharacterized LOC108932272 n=1 Tax=Scleropages formosus TaxID=113540 RepID=A0A8C9S6C3_SCLFO|nr:uncharacterized protein LOC108932272 [Scleropages formosus]
MPTNRGRDVSGSDGVSRPKNVLRVKVNAAGSSSVATSSAGDGRRALAADSASTETSSPPGGSRESARQMEKDTTAAKKNYRRGTPAAQVEVRNEISLPAETPPRSSQKKDEEEEPSARVEVRLPSAEAMLLGMGTKLDRQVVEEVERQTRGQRENPLWFACRQNRITASIAHSISHSRFVNGSSQTPAASYLSSVLGEGPRVMTRAMHWGVKNEAVAARQYERLKSKRLGRPVRVRECGLFVDPLRCWLAASPDGIVEDESTGERLLLLEIKCPYKHREHTVAEACEDRNFCLELGEGRGAGAGAQRYRLKAKHSYYTQVQCQMAVVGIHKMDFVLFTLKEVAIVPVTFDAQFWEDTVAKLELFYTEGVIPRLREKAQRAAALRPEL